MTNAFLHDLFSLHGRTALVTGGSSGIGKAIAAGLGQAGARLLLVARRPEPLAEASTQLQALGCTTAWVAGDVGDREQLANLAEQVRLPFGDPDILVTAAGVNPRPPLDELTLSQWDLTLAVNLEAPFLLGQYFGPGMAERGWGRILHIASQQSLRAFGNSGAYGVSKTAIAGLVRSQAEAWSPRGVCVNALGPAFVHTPLTAAVFSDPTRSTAMANRTMVGRNGVPEDLVGMAIALAGPSGSYVTGQTIFVDGGFSAT